MSEEQHKYWAFISYSHQDAAWASWLHKALEAYVVPRRLVGRETRLGPIPRRLFPVFRDRDELSSSAELGGVINEALRRSRYQIVICSPRSASSRWVNEEIRYFKSLGREGRVLALIIDGEPGAADRGEADRECFPLALRRKLGRDGCVLDQPTEPIAADARRRHGGRSEALLKLIAGLLDIGYDELRQRERGKLFVQRLRWLAAASALMLLLVGAWQAEQQRRAAKAHQALLMRLFDTGRQEMLSDHPARAATLLSAVYSGGYDSPAERLLLARAMKSIDAQTTVRAHHADEAPGVALWMPDGKRFLTLWRTARLWDAASGAPLRNYGNSEYSSGLGMSVTADGKRLMVEGQRDFTEDRRSLDLYDVDNGALLLHVDGRASANQLGSAFRSFSPDGRQLVLIEAGGSVAVHSAQDGHLLHRLPVQDASSAAHSVDGRRIVTADGSGRIAVWDAASGRRLFVFSSGRGSQPRAYYAPDGRIFVTDLKGRIRVHDGASGALIDALGGHTHEIRLSQFSADGRRLLTNADDGAKVWDMASGDQLLHANCDCGLAVNFDLDATGSRLLARTDALRVGLWDVDGNRLLTMLEGHGSEVNSMLFSPDGEHLLTAAVDGDAVVWTTRDFQPEPLHKLVHDASISPDTEPETYSGRYSPDGKTIVTTGSDGTARLWSAADGRLLHVLRGHSKTVYHAAFSPDGKLLATASDDLTARLWDVGSGSPRAVLGGHNRFVRRVEFSPDGRRLLTVAGTEPKVWDTADGHLVATLAGHEAPAVEGSFSADGLRVLTTGLDGTPRIFNSETGALLIRLKGHAGVVPFAMFVENGERVLTAGVDGTARVWNARSGAAVTVVNEPLAGPAGFRHGSLSHDGRRALLSASTGELILWDWQSGHMQRLVGHSIASYWSEFSADDQLAVSASNDGSTRLWNVATGAQLMLLRLATRSNRMWSAGFDPTAEHVVTAGYSKPPTAEVWDIPREQRRADEIAAILRCKSPWRLDGEQLVAHRPEAEACAALSQAAVTHTAVPPSAPEPRMP